MRDDLKKPESEILKYFLDKRFFLVDGRKEEIMNSEYYRRELNKYTPLYAPIELILSPKCSQKCEYCYLHKYEDELYSHLGTQKEILKNFDLLMQYFVDQKKAIPFNIELFAGDIFTDDTFPKLMAIFKKWLLKVREDNKEIFFGGKAILEDASKLQGVIEIPSNLQFVYNNPQLTRQVEEIIEEFQKEFNFRIVFSWSTDGYYCMDTREQKQLPDDWFDTIWNFCIRHKYLAHPMVSASNVKNWVKNYDWWIEKYAEFSKAINDPGNFQPFMLEVRNDDWTYDSIRDYLLFLNHIFEKRIEMFDSDFEKLAFHLFHQDEYDPELNPHPIHQDILMLNLFSEDSNKLTLGCSMPYTTSINLNDLSFPICHRTSYKHLIGGRFVLSEEKDRIVDIEGYNPTVFIAAKTAKMIYFPKCVNCDFNWMCIKGCFGSQFEHFGDLFMPIECVCDFFRAKYTHLLRLFDKYNIFDIALEKRYISQCNYDYYTETLRKGEQYEQENCIDYKAI